MDPKNRDPPPFINTPYIGYETYTRYTCTVAVGTYRHTTPNHILNRTQVNGVFARIRGTVFLPLGCSHSGPKWFGKKNNVTAVCLYRSTYGSHGTCTTVGWSTRNATTNLIHRDERDLGRNWMGADVVGESKDPTNWSSR